MVQVGSKLAGYNSNEGASAYQISQRHVMCLNPVQGSVKRSRRLLKKHLVELIEFGRREGVGCLFARELWNIDERSSTGMRWVLWKIAAAPKLALMT